MQSTSNADNIRAHTNLCGTREAYLTMEAAVSSSEDPGFDYATMEEQDETMKYYESNGQRPASTSIHDRVSPLELEETAREKKQDFDFDDEEIQVLAADKTIAYIVYASLAFFVFLFLGAMVACICIVDTFGFLTFVLVTILSLFVLGIGIFSSRAMDRDRVLQPVRRKIRRAHAVATAVILNELKDLQLDMHDHLLLTDSASYYTDDGSSKGPERPKTKRRVPRSKIFKLLVKPLLKQKKKFRFGKKHKKTDTGNTPGIV
mmetsp:Transcript_22094/g.33596  ORF Transcript_22094/g.33596 Transcript_22094/m.33596 type:complete len:261 (+) Transcript_22094:104-886(+)